MDLVRLQNWNPAWPSPLITHHLPLKVNYILKNWLNWRFYYFQHSSMCVRTHRVTLTQQRPSAFKQISTLFTQQLNVWGIISGDDGGSDGDEEYEALLFCLRCSAQQSDLEGLRAIRVVYMWHRWEVMGFHLEHHWKSNSLVKHLNTTYGSFSSID